MTLKNLMQQSMSAPVGPRETIVMGILNVTPDSFSDGGQHTGVEGALTHARKMIADGAHVLDIGGESTRPGSEPVSADEEMARVVPVIEALSRQWDGVISIDTMKPQVARAAMAAGASVWNDVTALTHSPDSLATAAELGCEIILMHMRGEPKTMQQAPHYENVVSEVCAHLVAQAQAAISAGVDPGHIWLDPGIGFAKNADHNLQLTAQLDQLCALGYPVLYAASRKRIIADLDPMAVAATDRLGGTIALHLEAVKKGASMVRVHDVRDMAQALLIQNRLERWQA